MLFLNLSLKSFVIRSQNELQLFELWSYNKGDPVICNKITVL